jgi:hypothetical protein
MVILDSLLFVYVQSWLLLQLTLPIVHLDKFFADFTIT